ncbi:MAG TPA: hypothetical protein VJ576_21290 [Rhodocyclaceae bacterium]|nr:hypothetical protein [Rhodocyclaceae bacterium]
MSHPSLPALIALSLVLTACGTTREAPVPPQTVQLDLILASGDYNCEDGLQVRVEREMRGTENYRLHIGWMGSSYWLERDPSYSGLPRFEDPSSGLVWIDLPWKSVLLDGRSNKPLASECKSV